MNKRIPCMEAYMEADHKFQLFFFLFKKNNYSYIILLIATLSCFIYYSIIKDHIVVCVFLWTIYTSYVVTFFRKEFLETAYGFFSAFRLFIGNLVLSQWFTPYTVHTYPLSNHFLLSLIT